MRLLSEIREAIEQNLKWLFVALALTLIVAANLAAILIAVVCVRILTNG